MKYLTGIMFVLIGVILLPTIFLLGDNAAGDSEIISYDTTLSLNVDDYTFGSSTVYAVGSVNTVEFCSQSVYAIVGDNSPTYLEVFKKDESGHYVELTENLPSIGAGVLSLSLTVDASRLAVGLTGGLDRIEVFDNTNDVWTKQDDGILVYATTAVQAVDFFGTDDIYLSTGVVNAGGSGHELKVYKWDSLLEDYTIVSSIDLGTVYDITSYDNYIIFSTEIAPYLYIYKMNENNDVISSLTLTDTPNVLVTDIAISDNGEYISATGSNGTPFVFYFDGNDTNEMILNNIPVGFTNLLSTQFAGSKFVYFGDTDTDIEKFEINISTGEWDNVINDIPTIVGRLRQLDFSGDYKHLFVGDNTGLEIYELDTSFIADAISLPVEFTDVISAFQGLISKSYNLVGNQLTVLDPDYGDATITYDVVTDNEYSQIIGLIPLVGVIVVLVGGIAYIKFR